MTEDQEKFESHFKKLKKATSRLLEALERKSDDLLLQDGVIQRFEFTFELAWKTMRSYMREKKLMDVNNPRDVLKAAFKIRLISKLDEWEALLDSRNQTVHVYDQNEATAIYRLIRAEKHLFERLIESFSEHQS